MNYITPHIGGVPLNSYTHRRLLLYFFPPLLLDWGWGKISYRFLSRHISLSNFVHALAAAAIPTIPGSRTTPVWWREG
ncbi:hypothetical protein CEXT_712441 [Caerostris extrusa]|uniref:Uncharacterized protein n=1 Tax=Caerostris extrusa TaxID=172846 RepID=A0AAV4U4E2_CAEEX|nr:hypothetical protein CEXT_712441 [Caerostris extrusa]